MPDDNGRIFREAWIAGVTQHYPGEPKPGYITGWDETPNWERDACTAVYDIVKTFVNTSAGATRHLNRTQRGQFIATCWTAQIHRLILDPKPSYVAPWDQLPAWQQQTDADIFDHIENAVLEATDR